MENDKQVEPEPYLVYCICMDMIDSTKMGLNLSTHQLDQFNLKLVEQIKPHLEKLDLSGAVLKFTGDGWLLITNVGKNVAPLCCLATIMANKFQDEMSKKTKIQEVSPLRISICSGRDIHVELPDGREDWVGDSARNAVRAAQWCSENEILIDETIRNWVLRDFETVDKPIDYESLDPKHCKKWEMPFSLYILKNLKIPEAGESDVPEYFIYTLWVLGRIKEAKKITKEVVEHLESETKQFTVVEVRREILRSWNLLLSKLPDYSFAIEIMKKMRSTGLVPDVFSYSTLIDKAPDYETAKSWLETMREEGIRPDVVSYSTLIDKAPDYETAKSWLETMRKEDIQPNVVSYSTLIDKAPDYETAETWLETMREEGIQPNVFSYSALINKAPDYETAKSWLETMRKEGIQPNVFSYSALINKAPDYETAKSCLETMCKEGIQPNIVSYSTLIDKAPDYKTAKSWLETMRKEGIQPDVVSYNTLIGKAPDYKTAKSWLETMRKEGIQPDVVSYSTLIDKAPDYKTAKSWLETMRKEGIQPDVFSYSMLINKAPDYKTAKSCLETMRKEGIKPNVFSYSALINKAPDYEAAKSCLETMRKEGIQPNVVSYNTLIDKAPDYKTAESWLETMREEGIQPDVVSYGTLFCKDLSGISADEILEWYLVQEYHPESPIQAAITSYYRVGMVKQSLRLALDYPHLQAARKLMRKMSKESLEYFKNVFDSNPQHSNAAYALGIYFLENGKEEDARFYLEKALKLAISESRKANIIHLLHQIGKN